MTVLDDFRQKYPQYKDIPDGKLASAIRTKYYADMDPTEFYKKAGLYHLIDANAGPNGQPAQTGLGSNVENALAGTGKSVYDNARGLAQAGVGLANVAMSPTNMIEKAVGNNGVVTDAIDSLGTKYDQLKANQSVVNEQDAPLMGTKAGLAGNIAGQGLQAIAGGTALKAAGLGSSILPQGYAGSAASGGLQGAIQPISTEQGEASRLANTGIGMAGGVGGKALVNLGGAAVRGIRALVAPLTNSGQRDIVANTIARFADGTPNPTASTVPGVKPTLAEATGSPGIAQLQRAVTDSDPAIAGKFVDQASQNNASRINYLRSLAGTPEDVSNAKAWRDQVAGGKYGQAFDDARSQQIARQSNADAQLADGQKNANSQYWRDDAAKALSDAQKAADSTLAPSAKMQDLGQRPVIQQAAKQAKIIAANQGVDIGDPMTSLKGQHYIKMALDDQLNTAPQMGIGKTEQAAIASAKKEFVTELERQNPAYKDARESFKTMSAPANRLEIAQGLVDRVTKNPVDVDTLGNPNLRPDAFGRSVGQLDTIARKVTGQKNALAADYLNPDQTSGISNLVNDLSRVKQAQNVGRSAGSNTVQNLASQNILSQTTKGLGLPGLAENSTIQRLVAPVNAAYKLFGVPDEIKAKLGQVLLDPNSAQSQQILQSIPKLMRPAIESQLGPIFGTVGQATSIGVSKQSSLQR